MIYPPALTLWKRYYSEMQKQTRQSSRRRFRRYMVSVRREAALERKLEVAQRKIEAQEQQLEELGKAYNRMRDTVMDLTL